MALWLDLNWYSSSSSLSQVIVFRKLKQLQWNPDFLNSRLFKSPDNWNQKSFPPPSPHPIRYFNFTSGVWSSSPIFLMNLRFSCGLEKNRDSTVVFFEITSNDLKRECWEELKTQQTFVCKERETCTGLCLTYTECYQVKSPNEVPLA